MRYRCAKVQIAQPTAKMTIAGTMPSRMSAGGWPDHARRVLRNALTTIEADAQIRPSAKNRK